MELANNNKNRSSTMQKDEGPAARLKALRDDPSAASVIFQRVANGETLNDIRRAWMLPRIEFFNWVCESFPHEYAAALKARSDPRVRAFLINRAWCAIGLPVALLPGAWRPWTLPEGGRALEYRASIDDCGNGVLTIRDVPPCKQPTPSRISLEEIAI
jgi:hypothetical protein